MNILYITVPSFFDLEISLIRELSKYCNVKVLMIVAPVSMHSSAFDINTLESNVGIYRASEMESLTKYDSLIDRSIWHLAINPTGSLNYYYCLSRLISKFVSTNEIDFIHNTSFGGKGTLFLLPLFRRVKYKLLTIHDYIPHSKENYLKQLLKKKVLNAFKNILTLSDSQYIEFTKHNRNSKLTVYKSQLGIYDFLHHYPISQNLYGKYILFFGRIDYYKGVDTLIKAFLLSKLPGIGYKLIIAGKGNINLTADKNVIVINKYIANDELATLINNSQFVVLPYRTVTQSGVLMSALAFNKPIIASRIGDFINEIQQQTGILTKVDDVKNLTDALESLSSKDLSTFSEAIEKRYGKNGERGWNTIAEKLYEHYLEISKSKNK